MPKTFRQAAETKPRCINYSQKESIMNVAKKTLFSATLLAAALAATTYAAPTYTSWDAAPNYPIVDQRSRAEVIAETVGYLRATKGAFSSGEARVADGVALAQPTRSQVLAEIAEAKRLGLITHGEATAFPTLQQIEQVRQAGLRAAHVLVARHHK
jgi:hypothetical protein